MDHRHRALLSSHRLLSTVPNTLPTPGLASEQNEDPSLSRWFRFDWSRRRLQFGKLRLHHAHTSHGCDDLWSP